jgi:hypothetical protein
MTDAVHSLMHHRPHLTLFQKSAVLISWSLAAGVFLTVGWMAMQPDDPQGAVSLLTRRGPILMLIQVAALAVVTSGLTTALTARTLPDMGVFATSIGLVAVTLQGGTASYLFMADSPTGASLPQGLPGKLAVESTVWFIVILLMALSSAWVYRWLFASEETAPDGKDSGPPLLFPLPAGYDLPGVGGWLGGRYRPWRTPIGIGVQHSLVAGGAALLAFALLSGAPYVRLVQHGQACFMVAVCMWIGVGLANRLVPVSSSVWSLGAVWLLAVGGYLWSGLVPPKDGLPASIPPTSYLRVLPIQYLSVGTATVIALFWYVSPPQPTKKR